MNVSRCGLWAPLSSLVCLFGLSLAALSSAAAQGDGAAPAAVKPATAKPVTAPPAAPLKPGPPHVVTIRTRDLEVEFGGDRAWTPQRILHNGAVAAERTGFYGTVFSEVGKRWIGTGHNEGGIEEIQSVTLTVDGKVCPLTDKAIYSGERAVIEKHSLLGPLKLQATYVVTGDALLERHEYEAMRDVEVGVLYAFMHPWVPQTTEWMATLADGTEQGGLFDGAGDHKFRGDPKWTAIYNPETRRVMVAWYPVPLAGQGIRTSFWDKKVYHKQYNQLFANAPLKAGTKFEARIVITGVAAEPATWKDAARAQAARAAAVKGAF